MKKIRLIGIIALGIGLVSILLVFVTTGGQFPVAAGKVTPRQATFSTSEVQQLAVDIDLADVDIVGADVNQITVDYAESDHVQYQVGVENGTLLVKNHYRKSWFFGIDFNFFFGDEEDREVKIEVPKAMLTSLEADLDVGDLRVSDLTIQQDGDITTDVGDVRLDNVQFGGKLMVSQDVGDVDFSQLLVGKSLVMDVNVGDVSGTMADEMANYTIISKVDVGNSNLPTRLDGGQKLLDVTGDVGDISIEFKQ